MSNDLSKWRIDKAEKTFLEATKLFESDFYSGAVNRYYYAAFHAVRALLATKQLDSAKHSGVIALFNREFIKTGIISKKSGKTLATVFNLRSEADYDDFSTFTFEQINDIKSTVRLLIDEIRNTINLKHL